MRTMMQAVDSMKGSSILRPFARMLANRLGTEHHELVLEPNVLEILEDLTWHLDEPLGDPSVIPTYMVSKLAAQHGKVVLSGDGGDELFAGYDKYAVEGRERNYDMVPATVRRLLGGLGKILPEGARGRNFLRHISLTGAARRSTSAARLVVGIHCLLQSFRQSQMRATQIQSSQP